MNQQHQSTAGVNLGHLTEAAAVSRTVAQIEELVSEARHDGSTIERARANRRLAVIETSVQHLAQHLAKSVQEECAAVLVAIADARADFLQDLTAATKDAETPPA